MTDLFAAAVEAGQMTEEERPRPGPYVLPTMEEVRRVPWNGLHAIGSFSGCGGSSLGMKMAGWSILSAIEFIPAAAATYRANFADTPVWERDIRQVTAEDLLEAERMEPGDLDCFEGSPPCASFSSAGAGSKDWGKTKKYSDSEQRTDDLFFEWMRLLEGLNPRSFIAENVPGMIRGRAIEEYAYKITRMLGDLGYAVDARVLNAAWFGVPQERERLIFVGFRRDQGLRPDLGSLPRIPVPHTLGQALARVTVDDPAHVAESSMERYAVGRTWRLIAEARVRGEAHPSFARLPCQRCEKPLDQHRNLEATSTGAITKATCADGEKAVIAKDYFMLTVPHVDEPCPTVTATGAQAGAASVTHPTECRKMTPAELRAVCSFPDDFILTGSREQQCERMGRAVPPLMYRAVASYVAEQLKGVE